MNWHPFGSMIAEKSTERCTFGRMCQRNGLVYRYAFDPATGRAKARVLLDGKCISND